MAIISSQTQNFHAGAATAPAARDNDSGLSKVSSQCGLKSLHGAATALPTSHPGFGSRNGGRFSVGDFLG